MNNPKTSPLAYIVVICQSLLAITCVMAICLAMFYKNYSDPATLSALFLLTGTLVGNLGSILGGPRSMSDKPSETKIINPASDPVQTTEADKPQPEIKP